MTTHITQTLTKMFWRLAASLPMTKLPMVPCRANDACPSKLMIELLREEAGPRMSAQEARKRNCCQTAAHELGGNVDGAEGSRALQHADDKVLGRPHHVAEQNLTNATCERVSSVCCQCVVSVCVSRVCTVTYPRSSDQTGRPWSGHRTRSASPLFKQRKVLVSRHRAMHMCTQHNSCTRH
jgi:hypothetical protein